MIKLKDTKLAYNKVIIVHEPSGHRIFDGDIKDCPKFALDYYVYEKLTNKYTKSVYLGVTELGGYDK